MRFDNFAPLMPTTADKITRDMCLAYLSILYPLPPEKDKHISRRCQHCQQIFQQNASAKAELYCPVCR